jgi:hypothetical protein
VSIIIKKEVVKMEITCLKLGAKRKMLKNNFRFFVVGALPFFTISLLTILNYYFINIIKKADFNLVDALSQYTEAIRMSFIVFLVILSFCVWRMISLCSQNYFYRRVSGRKLSFLRSMKSLSFAQYNSFLGVTIIKSLLSLSLCALYYLPCLAVSILLVYSYRYENYGFNVNLTLFVSSIMLFVTGSVFLFVTLKRYAFTTYVIFTEKERNPLKIITRSMEIMENRSVQYSLYCLSFLGWVLSCILIVPLIYAVPYINLSKWSYIDFLEKKNEKVVESEKPIIFYFQERKEV